ncbi:quinone-dependent dihydroorotate dehydrogenase [Candidatus Uhrbacteria bacterium CG_4_9_14_0_2_um_filter_41_50]|uniref:Dihydroorotate dehydrogenase (quinone) n=1 Tax=Candidatus Uhrbacteria bacterium CG_4_9_14_0_2_um_filter_41_50 TaxID=1975031 RepID=A0A2M8EQ78_9BACT|nr:MAG: quinone-dependent dihydroorotate dehydrogenase [Candidatus Uhrbacteria bacterium CG_4_10_14_3_um_filter_41_21]PIZ54692.1 MAG: quinone-dependent dihydroorotate dehydrogenase [Candidatus Uhrbacteria bacterium CG_4_10_14_0_2_um_filter_41_21]PJB84749.1 MAG: quinone-dependent dihydroorotate dehydrogenase [Candidatus Uhrbacteria bacterium CG_4_9_14_0_8_um_filter_41_16]PJC24851.1 MAG: quinone-dependent dihydroorotate dehydrogenase [Candidatus Uhrbacteria bacterium CG_4_9_14_0_2_um_filter_41_50]
MFQSKIQNFLYQKIAKPIFFKIDPELIHDLIIIVGQVLGSNPITRYLTKLCFYHSDKSLEQTILGINFKSPIGLAAGFDKNAKIINTIADVGFGFEEIGSVTGEPCAGNPKPRLWRLPKANGLVVYYGLKNNGCEEIVSRLKNKKFNIPVGVSIAKTNSPDTCETRAEIADYKKAYETFIDSGVGDYFTINVSCPNAFGGEPFSDPERLKMLLSELDKIETKKPIFIKIAVDITIGELNEITKVADSHRVHGFVIANLTKDKTRGEINGSLPKEAKGGISGRPTFEASNKLISHLYKNTGDKYVIIGVGGVFSAEDAYKKIKCGASLVQLITGMIFEGPQLIGQINKGLVELLKKDGFSNISEAIGATHK